MSGKNYVFVWPSMTKAPELYEVEVLEQNESSDLEEPWIEFLYLEGDFRGQRDGVSKSSIITEMERSKLLATWGAVDRAVENAKQLRAGAKDVWKDFLESLAEEDREL